MHAAATALLASATAVTGSAEEQRPRTIASLAAAADQALEIAPRTTRGATVASTSASTTRRISRSR